MLQMLPTLYLVPYKELRALTASLATASYSKPASDVIKQLVPEVSSVVVS